MENKSLNKKLAEWAGFTYKFGGEWFYEKYKSTNAWWEAPVGRKFYSLPDFSQSLDACFEWLVPKLAVKVFSYDLYSWQANQHKVIISKPSEGEEGGWSRIIAEVVASTPALALCLAIEKLIDKEEIV